MATIVEIPLLNPIPLRLAWLEKEEVRAFYAPYFQKYQQADNTSICIIANIQPVLKMVNEYGVLVKRIYPSAYDAAGQGLTQYTFKIVFNGITGLHRLTVEIAEQTYTSQLFCVQEVHKYTKLISYRNEENASNVIFSDGVLFSIRVECDYSYKAYIPKSEDITYQSSYGKSTILNSETWNDYRLVVGGSRGIADWLHAIINKAMGMSFISIDGVKITKTEGAEWEAIEESNYNLRSWTMEITEDRNRNVYSENFITINGESQATVSFPLTGGSKPVSVYSTGDWAVLFPISDWFTLSALEGTSGTTEITITAKDNSIYVGAPAIDFSFQLYMKAQPSVKCTLEARQEGIRGITEFDITELEHELNIDDFYKIPYTITPSDASDKRVAWESDNTIVVRMETDGSGAGFAWAWRAKGEATITGRTLDGSNLSDTIKIKVKGKPVESIEIETKPLSVAKGQTVFSRYEVTPGPLVIEDASVLATTSNKNIAIVTGTGTQSNQVLGIEGIEVGEAVIRLYSNPNPSVYDEVVVTVIGGPVTGFDIIEDSLNLIELATSQLHYTILPSDANNKTVLWSSSNTAIATVDANGLVSAKKPGTAIITGTTQDGNFTDTVSLVVTANPVFSLTSSNYSILWGFGLMSGSQTGQSTFAFSTADIEISEATSQPSLYISGNVVYTSISGNTTGYYRRCVLKVRQISTGKEITVFDSIQTPFRVETKIPLTSFSIDQDTKTITVGSVFPIPYTMTPNDATNQIVSWMSSNPNIASIDLYGNVVKGKETGTAIITGITQDGNITDTITIIVN